MGSTVLSNVIWLFLEIKHFTEPNISYGLPRIGALRLEEGMKMIPLLLRQIGAALLRLPSTFVRLV